jgi:hypothetical protein
MPINFIARAKLIFTGKVIPDYLFFQNISFKKLNSFPLCVSVTLWQNIIAAEALRHRK